jgi:hypothetical protein
VVDLVLVVHYLQLGIMGKGMHMIDIHRPEEGRRLVVVTVIVTIIKMAVGDVGQQHLVTALNTMIGLILRMISIMQGMVILTITTMIHHEDDKTIEVTTLVFNW